MAPRAQLPAARDGGAGTWARRDDGDVFGRHAEHRPRDQRPGGPRAPARARNAHPPQLGHLTGLSKPTATQLLQRLAGAGLIAPRGTTPVRPVRTRSSTASTSGPLRRSHRRRRAPRTVAVADLTGRILGEASTEVDYTTADDPVPAVRRVVGDACQRGGLGSATSTRWCWVFRRRTTRPDRLTFADHIPGWAEPTTLARLRAALRRDWSSRTTSNSLPCGTPARRRPRRSPFALLWAGTGLGLALDLGGLALHGSDRRRRRDRLHPG